MLNVLITGAGKGLGLELARHFHSAEFKLHLVVRSEQSLAQLTDEFPQARILNSDVSSETHEEALASWLGETQIDALINNAGTGSKGPTLETATAEPIKDVFDTNCIGVFSTVKAALPALKKAHNPLVLNISSRRGSMALQASGAAKNSGCSYSYRISKAAQNMLTLCLADDLEEYGIRVAAIHPGRLLTNMASKDATLSPADSAAHIVGLVLNGKIQNRDYLCVETGSLEW